MITVRLIPYVEIFVNITMTTAEATVVADVLASARERGFGADEPATKLEEELFAALDRADVLKKQRGY